MSDYEEKYQRAIAELENTSISIFFYQPLGHLLFKRLGIKLRPPHYNTFVLNCTFSFGIFTTIYLTMVILGLWRPFTDLFWPAIFIVSALVSPVYYAWSANTNSLTKWNLL